MGLDITAVSHLKHDPSIKPTTDEEYEDAWENGHFAFWYDGFDRSGRGLVRDSWYVETELSSGMGFRAGSYGGYNHWREDLARFVGLGLTDYWGQPDRGQPFYELINFGDNEGTIGPEAAADLLEDFRQHRDAYFATHPGDDHEYDRERYDSWIEAFELASRDGMVIFH